MALHVRKQKVIPFSKNRLHNNMCRVYKLLNHKFKTTYIPISKNLGKFKPSKNLFILVIRQHVVLNVVNLQEGDT